MGVYNLAGGVLIPSEEALKRKGTQDGWIQRRGKKWHIFFRELKIEADGSQSWKPTSRVVGPAIGPHKMTKAEALEDGRSRFVQRANHVTAAPSSTITLTQFVDVRYRPDCMEGGKLRPGTCSDYESLLRRHILPALGHCQLRHITRSMVQTLLTAKDKAGLSAQRVVHIRNVLSAILRHARRMNYLTGELATEDVIVSTITPQPRQPLNSLQIEMLMAHLKDNRVRVAVQIMTRLGLRAGEMAGLRWECVNLTDEPQWACGSILGPKQIWVREQYQRNQWSELKTARSNRRIPLPDDLVDLLRQWKAQTQYAAPQDTVCASRGGGPMDHHNVLARTLKPAAVKAGMPWVSWHNFRHTAATVADQYMSVHESMALLGHSSKRTTAGYTHVSEDALREKLRAMSAKGGVQ